MRVRLQQLRKLDGHLRDECQLFIRAGILQQEVFSLALSVQVDLDNELLAMIGDVERRYMEYEDLVFALENELVVCCRGRIPLLADLYTCQFKLGLGNFKPTLTSSSTTPLKI